MQSVVAAAFHLSGSEDEAWGGLLAGLAHGLLTPADERALASRSYWGAPAQVGCPGRPHRKHHKRRSWASRGDTGSSSIGWRSTHSMGAASMGSGRGGSGASTARSERARREGENPGPGPGPDGGCGGLRWLPEGAVKHIERIQKEQAEVRRRGIIGIFGGGCCTQ
jgi:hypothetical protein